MADFNKIEMEIREAAANLPPDIDLEFLKMFGGLGIYARGRIFAIVTGDGLGLKLPDDAISEAVSGGGRFLAYEPGGSPTKQYVALPESARQNKTDFGKWVERSIAHVMTLPPPKRRKK